MLSVGSINVVPAVSSELGVDLDVHVDAIDTVLAIAAQARAEGTYNCGVINVRHVAPTIESRHYKRAPIQTSPNWFRTQGFLPCRPILFCSFAGANQPSSAASVREFTASRTLFLMVCMYTSPVVWMLAQYALRVLQRAVLLHVGSQSSPHHLKGNETIRDARPFSNWADRPFEEALCPTRNSLTLLLPG